MAQLLPAAFLDGKEFAQKGSPGLTFTHRIVFKED
jgi:hypothetical protein